MGKMIGKKLYTYQTDDDDPITNKKSMKRREEAEWKKEVQETYPGGTLIGQSDGEVEYIVDRGSMNYRLAKMLEDLPQRTEFISESITITVRNPYTVEDADHDDLVNHWLGDPDDISTGEADCE